MNNKRPSPFTPNAPVPVELFVGRFEQLQEIQQCIWETSHGKMKNVFLVGERGIGKSSFASFSRTLAVNEGDFIGVHVLLGGVSTLEEMVRLIFNQLLKESKGHAWYDRIKKFFGNYIESVGFFGVSVSFNPPEDALRGLAGSFSEALRNLLDELDKKSLFIVLDDIGDLAGTADFANWFKSFADGVATQNIKFPVCMMLIGLPEERDKLSSLQPSLMRIFRIVKIERLSDDEIREFFKKAFTEAGMTIEPGAMNMIVHYSGGLPVLMQEIGDCIHLKDQDGVIDDSDALDGIIACADRVGEKYMEPTVYRAIRSESYRSILRKLGSLFRFQHSFTKREVEAKLSESEKKTFHHFLRRLGKLGVIERDAERGRGAYRFVNPIYPVYIMMEAKRHKSKKSR